MATNPKLNACLDLNRRMSPKDAEQTLGDLCFLAEDLTEELMLHIELPLALETDPDCGRKFIVCDVNRDGDSHRSPYTNKYVPPLDGGISPPKKLRDLEIQANEIFEAYVKQYYGNGNSSVYFWECPDGIAAGVFVKKDFVSTDSAQSGSWNSVHSFTFKNIDKSKYNIILITSVYLAFDINPIDLCGKQTKRTERSNVILSDDGLFLQTMGQMVEDAENNMRTHISDIFFSRTNSIVSDLRSIRNIPPNYRMVLPTGQN
ncbi:MAG: putative F-actin-capping protein subunit beta [Streblomastix strix]|uniref:F-actin-capping protein subunit beta n=1 Tax=Streblomastix strix TaxID=222440 RepID=A0A5J4WHP4_9EUKA|nr:MAG: putative F-actin-capping protein subunit beta [Streblomastix strix]